MNALELHNVHKKYSDKYAVNNISFSIPAGTIFGLLGPNGAGKTTLLRMITGILLPDSGEIYVNGKKTNLVSNAQFIGYMPEERGLYKKMKAEEQAIYLAQLKGISYSEAKKRVNYWFERLDMMDWRNKKVDEISKGMGQKLQFVCTIIHNPSLIILDEPFSGLDPLNADIIKNEIFELAKQGSTVIFSTHRMEQVEEICEQIVLIHHGQLILNDSVTGAKDKFERGQYILSAKALDSLMADDSIFSIVSRNEYKAVIKLVEGKDISQLLQYLSAQPNINLQSITKDIPSLNEIFIELVK